MPGNEPSSRHTTTCEAGSRDKKKRSPRDHTDRQSLGGATVRSGYARGERRPMAYLILAPWRLGCQPILTITASLTLAFREI